MSVNKSLLCCVILYLIANETGSYTIQDGLLADKHNLLYRNKIARNSAEEKHRNAFKLELNN